MGSSSKVGQTKVTQQAPPMSMPLLKPARLGREIGLRLKRELLNLSSFGSVRCFL